MKNLINDVRLFIAFADQRPRPFLYHDKRKLLAAVVLEEALEFVRALGLEPERLDDGSLRFKHVSPPDDIEVLDAVGDILFATVWASEMCCIDTEAIVEAVASSNLTKFRAGWSLDEKGKVIKSPLWEAPDEALKAIVWRMREKRED